MSRPPIPICPFEEKYTVPSDVTNGYISFSSELILFPAFIGFPHSLDFLSYLENQISFLPKPSGISDEK